MKGKDGVVFAVEKLVTSKLYEAGANKRIFTIDQHVGMVWWLCKDLFSYFQIMNYLLRKFEWFKKGINNYSITDLC